MLQTKCCKRPTTSIDSELSRDLWLPAHSSSLALCITYGGYWNLSVFNLFLHGLGFRGSLSVLPSSGLIGPPVPQQNVMGTGTVPGMASAASSGLFVNSSRSRMGNVNIPSQQQQLQQEQQQQEALMQTQ
ncbi:unnamed protein product [Sphagnum jensenii]